ncbi:hypothetical protein IJ531_05385, partial [bacterium]|nr:hypothetical protein [bacterium]
MFNIFSRVFILIIILSTLCILGLKPKMHNRVFVYDSSYFVVDEAPKTETKVVLAQKEQVTPKTETVSTQTKKETTQKKVSNTKTTVVQKNTPKTAAVVKSENKTTKT